MTIQLISGPRNISTALMYSFAQREDMSVVDEPMYAHYLYTTGITHPGQELIIKSQSLDPQQVIRDVIFGKYPTDHVFIKNMSKHMLGIDLGYCDRTQNVFLIRDPERLIASFAKVIDHPDESEIGLKASWKLFNELSSSSIVLNSDYVLENPKSILSQLCERMGIPFDENMLSWKPGPIPEDGVWAPYWYRSVHKSTGFLAPGSGERKVPNHLQPLLAEVMPYFEKLNQFALKPE
jgi:hypothetical protein